MFQILLAIIYLAFISLGLPDGLLGAAWPTMRIEMGLPVSYMGIISVIISLGTIISSLQSDRLSKQLGTGKVTAISVALTALALFGFSISHSFWLLCLFAIPYGLGAGSVDAALNNYVALHYSSKHMSWLHCMWGIGAAAGPYLMAFSLGNGGAWNQGYLMVALIQIVLTALLFISLPLWKKDKDMQAEDEQIAVLTFKEVLAIHGAKEIMVCFFCYMALEATAGLWSASFLVSQKGLSTVEAASFASLFYAGIALGRGINGFLAIRFSDSQLIRLGQALILFGLLVFLIPIDSSQLALIGLILVGLGCAPIYPCIIHSTPDHFGADKSQAVIGMQMAFAYTGMVIMPPLFGLLANVLSLATFPIYLLFFLILMVIMHERLNKIHINR